jgi:hypothetical protein
VTFKGKYLFVNADCPRGELKAEVLDKDGKVIEPFDLKNCEPVSYDKTLAEGELITKTVTDARIQWQDGFSLGKLKGNQIKLGFELRKSKLYSFSFE